MAKNVVQLDTADTSSILHSHLSDEEFNDLTVLCGHPSTIGHVVFGSDAGVIQARNVDELQVAAFANVFDICEALSSEIGQKSHSATILESRSLEITCRRFERACAVVMQGKGPLRAGV